VPELPEKAIAAFHTIACGNINVKTALDMLVKMHDYGEPDERIIPTIEHLLDTHMEALVKESRFRELMDREKDLRWRYIERSVFSTSLVKSEWWSCGRGACHGQGVPPMNISPPLCPECYRPMQSKKECWVPKTKRHA